MSNDDARDARHKSIRSDRSIALYLWLLVTTVSSGLHLFPAVGAPLSWHQTPDPSAIWTLLTSHFVHLSDAHLAANIAALTVLCISAQALQRARLLVALLIGSLLSVAIGLVAGPWPIAWYAGLSGVLYGCFSGLALELTREAAPIRWIGWGLLIGSATKIGFDLLAGVGASGVLGFPTAPPAHLYGFIGGLVTARTGRVIGRCPVHP